MAETLVRDSKGAIATEDAVVFVLDCDDTARGDIKRILESVELHVVPFRSAVEFLDTGIPETTCCLVLESCLPRMSGLALQTELTKADIQIPLIFVAGHGCIATAVRAMKAGAVDFLGKPINEQELLDAVFAALERDRLRRAKREAFSLLRKGFKSLTPRERQVLFSAAAGRLNKQIANELGVSEIMVKVHRSHAMRKLNAKSFADLVRMSDLLQNEILTTATHESAPRAVKLR